MFLKRLLFFFALLSSPGLAAAPEPKAVLVLEQEDAGRPAYVAFMSGLRPALAQKVQGPLQIFSENLDLARFDSPEYRAQLENWLRGKYAGRRLDAVVVAGTRSLDLVLKMREGLWPGVPVVFTAIPSAAAAKYAQFEQVTAVTMDLQVDATLAAALEICPGTERVAFVSDGKTYPELHNASVGQASKFAQERRLEFLPLVGLSMEETRRHLRELPPKTIVFYLQINVDAVGGFYIPRDALALLSADSSAPIFSVMETYLGFGTVGGVCVRFTELGREVAEQTAKVLEGQLPPIVAGRSQRLLMDWNELRRHQLYAKRGEVLNLPPKLWETRRGTVLATVAVLLIQSGLIFALLAELRRRRRAEGSLRESEERQNLAAESASVGFWSLEKGGSTFWVSPATLGLFGFPAGTELTVSRFLELVHPEDRADVQQSIERSFSEARNARIEYRVLGPGETVRWFASIGRSRVNAKGEIAGISGISIDITRRKEAEAALGRVQALTDAVFDSVPGLLYLYSADGKLRLWNKQHEEITGYSAGELSRMEAHQWFDEEDQRLMTEAWNKVFETGAASAELRLKLKDGRRMPVLLTGVSLEIEGQPHLVGIAIDITERKRLEEQAQKRFQELAHISRVAVLGELTASLAHELNQPLGAILRNAETAEILLRQEPPDLQELRAIVADICKDDLRAGQVIERLRSLLKRRQLEPAPLELHGLIADTLSLVRADAKARKVAIKLEVPTGLPSVLGDRVHLQQVFLNLLINAIEALEARGSGRKIVVSVSQDPSVLRVSVQDNGPGILPGDSERLFESFFSSKPNGLGMGLSISRTIVEAHGGRIWAEDNLGRGATFHFTLPLAAGLPTP